MKKLIDEFKRNFILLSAASLTVGLLFLIFPETSGLVICYKIGRAHV